MKGAQKMEMRFPDFLQRPSGIADAVLDTDAYNEIDDQFALAYLMKSPEKVRVRAIYAAPFFNAKSESPKDGMEKSHAEILKVLELMEMGDFAEHVFRGSGGYLPSEKEPVVSDAAADLVRRAMEYDADHPLYVVAIGAVTNIASALLIRPEIRDRIVLIWLGGNALHWPDNREFNMIQDIAAARVVFGCGVPLVHVPCSGVVDSFRTTGPELEFWLRGRNRLCDYLVDNTVREAESYAKGQVWSRVIWDVAAAGWLLDPRGERLSDCLIPSPVPEYDHFYGTSQKRHLIRYVYAVDRDKLLAHLFGTLAR